jgi:hypothetical protein
MLFEEKKPEVKAQEINILTRSIKYCDKQSSRSYLILPKRLTMTLKKYLLVWVSYERWGKYGYELWINNKPVYFLFSPCS